ncbi:MAG: 50S ribosomal protein L16 [Planctomycetota bacterium]|nr:MAG: 50S ribosomal protein L16 [Planctomycetota bacterium]
MVLMPKRVKYRKQQRGRIRGNATRGNTVEFGEWGIQALERGYITARQIEAARVALNRAIGGVGQFWLRIFPHKPVTAKPNETRMGKGKGDVKEWVAVVKPGTIIFELSAVSENLARLAFNRQAHKLPLKVRLVRRKHA